MNEYSLHSEIKDFYSISGDQFEVKLGNYIFDILRGDMIIEVQTRNFSAIKKKLQVLTEKNKVRLVYPLPERKWITYINQKNIVIKKQKSPKRGKITDVFRELVMIPTIIGEKNFSMEILLIDAEEIRCNDGKGSWRRRGVSIIDKKLLKVNGRVLLQNKADYLKILPENLNEVFTNIELAKSANIPVRAAQQITYCFKNGGIIQTVGKKGRALLFRRV